MPMGVETTMFGRAMQAAHSYLAAGDSGPGSGSTACRRRTRRPRSPPCNRPCSDAQAATASAQSAGDNAWMLTSAALVLLMTGPGLALFYGGLVRKKNILGTMMQSFAMMGLVTILWAIVRLLAGLRPRQRVHRRLRASFPARRSLDAESRLRRHHSRADVHDLPAHVRHHHAGADLPARLPSA